MRPPGQAKTLETRWLFDWLKRIDASNQVAFRLDGLPAMPGRINQSNGLLRPMASSVTSNELNCQGLEAG